MKKKIIIGCIIIGILLISISLYFILVNKNEKDIRNSIDDFFNCVKQEEQTTKNKFLSIKNADIKDIIDNSDYYKLLVQDLNYTILSLDGNFKDATVLVEVSNKNSEEAIKEFLKKRKEVKNQSIEQVNEENETDETENDVPTDDSILKEQVELANTEKNIIKFELHKENKKWTVSNENKEDISNVLLPDIDNISDEFIEEIKKENVEEPTEKTEEVNAQDNSKGINNKKTSNKQNTSSSASTSSNNVSTQTSNPAPAQQQVQTQSQSSNQASASVPNTSAQSAPVPSTPAPSTSPTPAQPSTDTTAMSAPVNDPNTMSVPANDPTPQPSEPCKHERTGPGTIITPAGIKSTTVCLDCGAEV